MQTTIIWAITLIFLGIITGAVIAGHQRKEVELSLLANGYCHKMEAFAGPGNVYYTWVKCPQGGK